MSRRIDIYVRWKSLAEQPIGWDPDLNDGVRLNIRPFVEAGVLRSKFNIHWNKDRGKNPDGTERHNDIHLTLAEKSSARAQGADVSDTVLDRSSPVFVRRATTTTTPTWHPLRCCGLTRLASGSQWWIASPNTCRSSPSETSIRHLDAGPPTGSGASSPALRRRSRRRRADCLPAWRRTQLASVRLTPARRPGTDRRAAVPEPVVLPSERSGLVCSGTADARDRVAWDCRSPTMPTRSPLCCSPWIGSSTSRSIV